MSLACMTSPDSMHVPDFHLAPMRPSVFLWLASRGLFVIVTRYMDAPYNMTGLVKTWGDSLVGTARALLYPLIVCTVLVMNGLSAILSKMGQVLVNATAAFLSAVLSHPNVVTAASNVMVAGMNAFADQPDLPDILKKASQQMSVQDKQQAAVQIGRDLPVLVGGIFHGVFSRNDNDKSTY